MFNSSWINQFILRHVATECVGFYRNNFTTYDPQDIKVAIHMLTMCVLYDYEYPIIRMILFTTNDSHVMPVIWSQLI